MDGFREALRDELERAYCDCVRAHPTADQHMIDIMVIGWLCGAAGVPSRNFDVERVRERVTP